MVNIGEHTIRNGTRIQTLERKIAETQEKLAGPMWPGTRDMALIRLERYEEALAHFRSIPRIRAPRKIAP